MALFFIRLSIFTLIYSNCDVLGDRTKQKIYVDFPAIKTCFRRLNGTHQIGCQSDRGGNVGTLHFVNDSNSMDWIIKKGPHHPYAVLLPPELFNVAYLRKLKDSGKVNGILLEHTSNTTPPVLGFSPDKPCPNMGYGEYSTDPNYGNCQNITWNDAGNSLMFEDFSIPIIVLTNRTNVEYIIDHCYTKYNKPDDQGNAPSYPLCAAELLDRMDAAKDSETCIRRSNLQMNLNPTKYCDPLGDYNIYGSFKAVNKTATRNKTSIIVAAARMDSFSLFEDLYPSADSSITGLVTLLAAAEAIRKKKKVPTATLR